MRCKRFDKCLFLKQAKDSELWILKYCNDINKAQKCKRLQWCICRGPIPANFSPDGERDGC